MPNAPVSGGDDGEGPRPSDTLQPCCVFADLPGSIDTGTGERKENVGVEGKAIAEGAICLGLCITKGDDSVQCVAHRTERDWKRQEVKVR